MTAAAGEQGWVLPVAPGGLVDAGPFRSNGRVVHGTGSAGIAPPKTLVETL